MKPSHKEAISKSRSHHPMLARMRKHDPSLATLSDLQGALAAQGYHVSRAFLSMVMTRKKPCPPLLRSLIWDLTGWLIGADRPKRKTGRS